MTAIDTMDYRPVLAREACNLLGMTAARFLEFVDWCNDTTDDVKPISFVIGNEEPIFDPRRLQELAPAFREAVEGEG